MDTETRIDLEVKYAEHIVEGMDMDTLVQFALDCLSDNLMKMDDDTFLADVREYAPHLLDD